MAAGTTTSDAAKLKALEREVKELKRADEILLAASFSRRIVGWRTAVSMPTDLPLNALEMALRTRAELRRSSTHWCTTPTPARRADSTGRRNTSIRYANQVTRPGELRCQPTSWEGRSPKVVSL